MRHSRRYGLCQTANPRSRSPSGQVHRIGTSIDEWQAACRRPIFMWRRQSVFTLLGRCRPGCDQTRPRSTEDRYRVAQQSCITSRRVVVLTHNDQHVDQAVYSDIKDQRLSASAARHQGVRPLRRTRRPSDIIPKDIVCRATNGKSPVADGNPKGRSRSFDIPRRSPSICRSSPPARPGPTKLRRSSRFDRWHSVAGHQPGPFFDSFRARLIFRTSRTKREVDVAPLKVQS